MSQIMAIDNLDLTCLTLKVIKLNFNPEWI